MDINNKYNMDLSYLYKKYKKKIPNSEENIEKIKQKKNSSIELQEIWRQKQINIFYKTGRPIYGKYIGSRLVCDIH
jgi:hypothetical protein